MFGVIEIDDQFGVQDCGVWYVMCVFDMLLEIIVVDQVVVIECVDIGV